MKKMIYICLIIFICISAISTIDFANTSNTKSTTIEDGEYVLESSLDRNKVVTVTAKSKLQGANVAMYEDEGFAAQRYKITKLNDGYYKIQSINSGKVLDVYAGLKQSGTNVQQYTWNNTDAQKWKILSKGNGYYSFISKCNGLYLDIYAGSTNNGANVQVYKGNGSNAQKFYLRKFSKIQGTKTLSDGIYTIKTAVNTKKAVTISSNYKELGANVELAEYKNLARQQFKFTYLNNGYYKIESVGSGKVLDVYAGLTKSGTNVQQYNWNNSNAQQWIVKKESNGYYSIISKCNDLYLDIWAGIAKDGANVQIYKGNGSKAQMFEIQEYKQNIGTSERVLKDGIYNIKTGLDENRYVEVTNESTSNLANVQIWSKTNKQNQQIKLTYLNEGYYKMEAVHSGKVIDVYGAGKTNGTNVDQYDWNNSDAQKWIIKDAGNGYFNIISKCNGLYMDVYAGINQNGINVDMYTGNGTNAQKFKFIEASKNDSNILIDGIYSITSALSGNVNLDVLGGGKTNGTNVGIWKANDTMQQRFSVKYEKDGYYKIQAMHSGKVLEVAGSSKNNGANVQQYTWNNTDNQKWYIKYANEGYYYIVSKCNGLYMDIYTGSNQNGTNVQVYKGNRSNAQKFKFVSASFGIDVSKYQGNIDFDKLVNSKRVDFIISRAGYYSETRKKFIVDETFSRNYQESKKRNLPIGSYIYSYALNKEDAINEANQLINYFKSINATKLDLPVFIDIEDSSQSGLSKSQITEICLAYGEQMKKAGYKTGIYASKYWYMTKIDISKLPADYCLWVASYGNNDGTIPDNVYQYKEKHDIWQYTSTGNIPGINGNVDMNISYKNIK